MFSFFSSPQLQMEECKKNVVPETSLVRHKLDRMGPKSLKMMKNQLLKGVQKKPCLFKIFREKT